MTTYTKHWFEGIAGTSEASARVVAPMIVELVGPRSVVDIGCGTAGWAGTFAACGVQDVIGVDGDYVDRTQLKIPADRFRAHDLTKPLDLGRTFDLAICLEVAEHLPESVADQFVATLTGLAPAVLFSAGVPGQGGNNHVNEQWQSYWVEKFAARGYGVTDPIRPKIWDNDGVEWWYRQNMLLFVSAGTVEERPALRGLIEAAQLQPMDVVHPGMMEQYLIAAAHPVRSLARHPLVRARQTAKKLLGG